MKQLIRTLKYKFKKVMLYLAAWEMSGRLLKMSDSDVTPDEYKLYDLHEFLDLLEYKHKIMPSKDYPQEWPENDYESHRKEIKRRIGLLKAIDVRDVRAT